MIRLKPDNLLREAKGFTIAELILVISIIGILFAIGTRTYRDESSHFMFNDSLSRIITLMKTARNYAVTSRAVFAEGELVIPPEGYGVHIRRDTKKITLFANIGSDLNWFDEGDLEEETYTLPKITSLEGILKDDRNSPVTAEEAVVIFRPPLADTFITNDLRDSIDTLYLKISSGSSAAGADKKFISINRTAGFPELELRD